VSSTKLIRWAAQVDVGSTAEKALLLVLVSHADREGHISPGPAWSTLAAEATMSRSTVHVAMGKLVDRGLVEILNQHRANGSHTSNDYRLLWSEAGSLPVRQPDGFRSDSRTGSGPTAGPVRQPDRSLRSDSTTGLNSENTLRSDSRTGSGPTAGPPEEKIKNSGSSVRAPAPARDPRARARGNINNSGQEQLQQLADSAGVSKDAYVLVTRWRSAHGTEPYTSNLYTRIGKVVTKLLADGWATDVVMAALVEWDRRPPGSGPGLVADLCDDVLRARRNGTVTPLIQRDGSCSMPVDLITDDMLTRRVLEDILGPDLYPPLGTREVEEAEPDVRKAWYDAAGAKRLAERRAEARALLARQQQRAGSA
jgi:hypothetical protein